MAARHAPLTFKRTVNASPEAAYRLFTSSAGLAAWLAQGAEARPRKGGRLLLWWDEGYFAGGTYRDLVPGKRVAFSWMGSTDPAPTEVKVTFKPGKSGTKITLEHSGLGGGKRWTEARKEFEKGWERHLENLQSVLETGEDLRITRRPVMGITGAEELTAESAARLGLPVGRGLVLDGVAPGWGAEAAGLRQGDVIVKFDGAKIGDWPSLLGALKRHRAGDTVKVVFYRGAEKQSAALALMARAMMQVPATAAELADAVETLYRQVTQELDAALAGADDELASASVTPGEWSVKEVLAHLIVAERDLAAWTTGLIDDVDTQNAGAPDNVRARLQSVVAVHATLDALRAELGRAQAETVALLRLLPAEFVEMKAAYWRAGERALDLAAHHTREHLDQIRAAQAAARPARQDAAPAP